MERPMTEIDFLCITALELCSKSEDEQFTFENYIDGVRNAQELLQFQACSTESIKEYGVLLEDSLKNQFVCVCENVSTDEFRYTLHEKCLTHANELMESTADSTLKAIIQNLLQDRNTTPLQKAIAHLSKSKRLTAAALLACVQKRQCAITVEELSQNITPIDVGVGPQQRLSVMTHQLGMMYIEKRPMGTALYHFTESVFGVLKELHNCQIPELNAIIRQFIRIFLSKQAAKGTNFSYIHGSILAITKAFHEKNNRWLTLEDLIEESVAELHPYTRYTSLSELVQTLVYLGFVHPQSTSTLYFTPTEFCIEFLSVAQEFLRHPALQERTVESLKYLRLARQKKSFPKVKRQSLAKLSFQIPERIPGNESEYSKAFAASEGLKTFTDHRSHRSISSSVPETTQKLRSLRSNTVIPVATQTVMLVIDTCLHHKVTKCSSDTIVQLLKFSTTHLTELRARNNLSTYVSRKIVLSRDDQHLYSVEPDAAIIFSRLLQSSDKECQEIGLEYHRKVLKVLKFANKEVNYIHAAGVLISAYFQSTNTTSFTAGQLQSFYEDSSPEWIDTLLSPISNKRLMQVLQQSRFVTRKQNYYSFTALFAEYFKLSAEFSSHEIFTEHYISTIESFCCKTTKSVKAPSVEHTQWAESEPDEIIEDSSKEILPEVCKMETSVAETVTLEQDTLDPEVQIQLVSGLLKKLPIDSTMQFQLITDFIADKNIWKLLAQIQNTE